MSLFLFSCDNKESIKVDNEKEKQENINTHDKEEYKPNLTLEEMYYGAKYCLSVTKQIKRWFRTM
jgi:hypothetical protein